jgi:hypothetical protein
VSDSHYVALMAGYGVSLAGWLAAFKFLPALWPRVTPPAFKKPWHEIGYALLAVVAILLVGQAYQREWRHDMMRALQSLPDAY